MRVLTVSTKVIDFESQKQAHLHKRKEAKVDQLRQAFRLARGETSPDKPKGKSSGANRRGKTTKK